MRAGRPFRKATCASSRRAACSALAAGACSNREVSSSSVWRRKNRSAAFASEPLSLDPWACLSRARTPAAPPRTTGANIQLRHRTLRFRFSVAAHWRQSWSRQRLQRRRKARERDLNYQLLAGAVLETHISGQSGLEALEKIVFQEYPDLTTLGIA